VQTLYAGSVAKYFDRPDDNEDRFKVVEDGRSIVVCDGASESFDAAKWATLVTEHFHSAPLSSEGLLACVEDYDAAIEPASLSWSKQMAFERGSFSTLSRVAALDDGTLEVTCVGDSLVVLTDGDALLHCQPYAFAELFEERPLLLSTLAIHNAPFMDEGFVATLTQRFEVPDNTACFVLMMTDALGQWLLSHMEAGDSTALKDLLSVRSDIELAALVEHARSEGTMRRDDSTLVVAMGWDAS
jgi:serine/threonine protein phosphatase PrpC